MIAPEYFNNHIAVEGEIIVKRVPNDTGSVVVWNSTTKKLSTRTHAEIVSDLNLMTTDTAQDVIGTKNFINSSGNSGLYDNRLHIKGTNGSKAGISFWSDDVGQLNYYNTAFHFKNQFDNAYQSVKALSFVKDGSDDNSVLLGGGGQAALSDFATKEQLNKKITAYKQLPYLPNLSIENKWLFFKIQGGTGIGMQRSYERLDENNLIFQGIVPEGQHLVTGDNGDNYTGLLRTVLYSSIDKTISLTFTHDDGCAVYINGIKVYESGGYRSGAPLSFDIKVGYTTIDFIWDEGGGGDGIMDINPTIGSQVEKIYLPQFLNSNDFVGNKIINGSYDANNLSNNSITYGYSVWNSPASASSHSFTILNLDTANPNFKMQIGFDGDTNEMFSRIKSGGSWNSWSKYITSSQLTNFVTTDTNQLISGLKAFITGGGNYGPTNNALQIYADDGSLPSMTYSKGGSHVGQIMFDSDGFYFKNGDNNAFYNVKAGGFEKNNSNNSYVLLGGGDHKPISDFALSSDLSNAVTTNTAQTITADKVFKKITTTDWIIPKYLAFPDASGALPNYIGFYMWNSQWQVNWRDPSNNHLYQLLDIDGLSKNATFYGNTVSPKFVTAGGNSDQWNEAYNSLSKKEDDWYHSARDFPQGTLIKTDVDYSQTYGDQFLLEMKGNMYGGGNPLIANIQGYIYYDTIIAKSGYSTLYYWNSIIALNLNGKLCFWFPSLSYWQGFDVKVTIGYGGVNQGKNRVLSVSDSADPGGSKRVEIALEHLLTKEQLISGNTFWEKKNIANYWALDSDKDVAVLNGSSAQRLFSGGLLASDVYSDSQYIPSYGIHAKGSIQSDEGFVNRYYKVNQRNKIWNFGNSTAWGLSYFQGNYHSLGEGISFHFGDGSSYQFFVKENGRLYSSLDGNSNEWKTGYNRSISTTSYSHGDNGDVLNLTTAEGGVHNPTRNGFKVLDTRYSTIIDNPDSNAGYLPKGNVGALDNRVSSIFHTSSVYGGDWASSLIVKGWSGNYKAWRLTGTAGANDEEDDLFLSNTKTSDGSWYSERKILTTKHLSQSTIDNLNTISNGTLLRGTAVNTNFDEHENKFGWINGTTSQLGGITSWTGNWITIGSAPGNGHKSQLLLSKGRLLFRTMHGIEDVNFNEVIHDGNLTTNINNFLPTYLQNLSHSINFQNNLGGIQGMMADNDFWRLKGGNNGSNNGYVELATGDDGNEEIYVSQYTGVFGSLTRRAKLLDSLGDTYFPGQIYNRGQYIVWDSGHFNPDNFLTTNTTQFIDSEKTINANKTLYSGFARGNSPNSQLGPLSLLNLALQGAYPLYGDEEFKNGTNSIQVYNNLGNGSVVITHETSSQQLPNRTGKQLRINYNSSLGATPGLGGFILHLPHRANAIFVQKFMAKLPVGYTFQNAENYLGDEGNVTWLTPRNGTGKWETYVRMSVCGHGSSFGNGGHVYVDGPNVDLEFYLCFAEAYEVNSSVYSKIKENFYAKNEAIDFTNNLDQLMKVGELSWAQRTVLERGWNSTHGDYIQLKTPGSTNNSAALLMNQSGNIYVTGGSYVSNNLTGGQVFNGAGQTLYVGNGALPNVHIETENFRIYNNNGTVLKYIFNNSQFTTYSDINLESVNGDLRDIVWSDTGSEKHRLLDSGFAGTLGYRNNGGTVYALLHSGNFSSYLSGSFITTDSTPQTKTGDLILNSGANLRINGTDSNSIRSYRDTTGDVGIVAGWLYNHYATSWKVGNRRGGSTDSQGFGFEFSDNNGSIYTEKVRFNTDGNIVTQNFGSANLWNTAYSWGNHANAGYQLSTNAFKVLRYTTNVNDVSESGIYRQEIPISGYNYTTTLNLNSGDGRQQLTIERGGAGMKFRGTLYGSGDQGWSDWKTVLTKEDTQSITGLKTIQRPQSVGAYYGLTNNKDLHSLIFEMGQGPNTGDNRGASIGFFNVDSGGVMAGMYVKNNAQDGTHMAFATTNSYAAGPQVGMTLNNNGVVDFPRTLPTFQGSVLSTQSWVNETVTNYIPNYSNWGSSTYINQRKVVGELAWKNYGNGHTIFDISNGTTPWGVSKSNVDAEIPWQNSFPTLVGGNGSNTYGVRVDSARIADKVNGYDLSTFSTQTWVNTNFIPKTHPVFNITQNNINTWNNNVMPTNYVTTDTMQIISGPKEFAGSIFASGGISSINGNSAEVFVGNSNTASLKDEIVNDESDYSIRLDPHHYEIDSSGNLDVDDRNRLIHIIGEQIKMAVNFKEIYPKQQIVIYNFDQKGNGMQVLIKGKNVYNIEPGCFLRLYVTKSLRVIAERQQPCEFIW